MFPKSLRFTSKREVAGDSGACSEWMCQKRAVPHSLSGSRMSPIRGGQNGMGRLFSPVFEKTSILGD